MARVILACSFFAGVIASSWDPLCGPKFVADNEGEEIGEYDNVNLQECISHCEHDGCHSFAICQWGTADNFRCFLKNAVFTGSETCTPNEFCTTYYKPSVPSSWDALCGTNRVADNEGEEIGEYYTVNLKDCISHCEHDGCHSFALCQSGDAGFSCHLKSTEFTGTETCSANQFCTTYYKPSSILGDVEHTKDVSVDNLCYWALAPGARPGQDAQLCDCDKGCGEWATIGKRWDVNSGMMRMKHSEQERCVWIYDDGDEQWLSIGQTDQVDCLPGMYVTHDEKWMMPDGRCAHQEPGWGNLFVCREGVVGKSCTTDVKCTPGWKRRQVSSTDLVMI